MVAVALVDLAQHDQRHRQMVDQAEPAVEVDGGFRRLDALRLAAIGERAVGHREVGVSRDWKPRSPTFLAISRPRRQVSMLRGGSSEL